jgi:hypothetical protein
MKRQDDPQVVDLRRYRKTQKAARKAQAAPPASSQRLLGARPRAGLILVLVVLAMLALWIAPKIL